MAAALPAEFGPALLGAAPAVLAARSVRGAGPSGPGSPSAVRGSPTGKR